jgi:hexosaminidase
MKGHYTEHKYDGKPYGGFYTQEQIKEVLKYAEDRFVNVIPEIEMPGHALAALAAYPQLGNNPDKIYETGTKWGVYDDVFMPREETCKFLENVLSEVIDLFPASTFTLAATNARNAVERKPVCARLIKKENLKDEHGLQSYVIKRIDKFITAKGRRMIGWDEILEGGLSPNATVMSWRGIEGGITAAKERHDVIMTPGNFCYLDHYQADAKTQPIAIGGFHRSGRILFVRPNARRTFSRRSEAHPRRARQRMDRIHENPCIRTIYGVASRNCTGRSWLDFQRRQELRRFQ